jgi:pimeloyl-ACP methyl ester carboxylesterase
MGAFLVRLGFASVPKIKTPVLIFAGLRDRVIPFVNDRRLGDGRPSELNATHA